MIVHILLQYNVELIPRPIIKSRSLLIETNAIRKAFRCRGLDKINIVFFFFFFHTLHDAGMYENVHSTRNVCGFFFFFFINSNCHYYYHYFSLPFDLWAYPFVIHPSGSRVRALNYTYAFWISVCYNNIRRFAPVFRVVRYNVLVLFSLRAV